MSAATLTGCGTVLAVLLLRRLLDRRLPRRVLVLLWVGALVVLLLPGRLHTAFSVYTLLPRRAAAGAVSPTGLSSVWPLLRRWGTGLGLAAVLISYVLGLIRIYGAKPCQNPAVLDWLAAHPLLRPLRVCTGRVHGPLCGGLLFPRIVLPQDMDWKDRAALDCVLSHEYVHICRFDPLLKLGMAVVLCLRWYDPLVWIAVLTAGRDMEYACDEAVLDMGIEPKRYAAVLLRAALRRASPLTAAVRLNAGQMERRISRVTAHRPRSVLCWLGAGLLAALLLLGFGTAPRAASPALPASPSGESAAEPPARALTPPHANPVDQALLERYEALAAQWNEDVRRCADPYANLRLLGESGALSLEEVGDSLSCLTKETGAGFLRVTDDGQSYTIQAYTDKDLP